MYLIWALSIKGKNNWLVLLGRITMLNPRNNMLLLSWLRYIVLWNNYRCQNCSNLFTETTVDPWSEKQPPLPNQTSIQCTHTGYPLPPPWSYKTQMEVLLYFHVHKNQELLLRFTSRFRPVLEISDTVTQHRARLLALLVGNSRINSSLSAIGEPTPDYSHSLYAIGE